MTRTDWGESKSSGKGVELSVEGCMTLSDLELATCAGQYLSMYSTFAGLRSLSPNVARDGIGWYGERLEVIREALELKAANALQICEQIKETMAD